MVHHEDNDTYNTYSVFNQTTSSFAATEGMYLVIWYNQCGACMRSFVSNVYVSRKVSSLNDMRSAWWSIDRARLIVLHCILCYLSNQDLPFLCRQLIEILKDILRIPTIVRRMAQYPDQSEDVK